MKPEPGTLMPLPVKDGGMTSAIVAQGYQTQVLQGASVSYVGISVHVGEGAVMAIMTADETRKLILDLLGRAATIDPLKKKTS